MAEQCSAAAAPDSRDLRRAVLQFKDEHADVGKGQWTALRYHFGSLRSLLLAPGEEAALLGSSAGGSSRWRK
jgi:hypothetical protein